MYFPVLASALTLVTTLSSIASGHPHLTPRSNTLSVKQILAIAPKSSTCAGAPYPAQCRTAQQALSHIGASFRKYELRSNGEQAAVIGMMAFESGDFKYNVNVFPGRPGQGTRNMQSAAFNEKYALSIPALSAKVADAKKTSNPNAIRDLLTANDDYDFGSAAWFLKTQCKPDVIKNLASGSLAGWQAYVKDCVGTEANDERKAYYDRALKALSG